MNTENNQENPVVARSIISLPAAIITGAVILGIAVLIAFGPKSMDNRNVPDEQKPVTSVSSEVATIRSDDKVRGDQNTAQVAIIEYADSDCYWCGQFHPTLISLVDEYKGKVMAVYRHYPVASLHPNAINEAYALECVAILGGNDEFNEYLDNIIGVTLTPNQKSNDTLVSFAKSQGLDENKFRTCMSDPKVAETIDQSINEAIDIGARGTPFSIVVNVKTGEQVIVPGAASIESMRGTIDSLL